MSETYAQMTFWPDAAESTSSPAASHASRRRLPASVSARRIPDGSGPNTCDSSWISSLSGYLRRTCQVFYRSGNQDRCSLIWKRRVTKSGRLSWVLGRSVPRTNGTACGLSGGWPSPDARDAHAEGLESGKRRLEKWGTQGLQTAATLNQWPSPRQSDANGAGLHGDGGMDLRTKAQQWPTPRTEDSEQTGAHWGTPYTLTSAARVWPTPAARDWKNDESAPADAKRHSPCLPSAVFCAGPPDPANHSTSGKPTDWWATPRVSVLEGHAVATDTHGWDLPAQTKHEQRIEAGQLNPDWVEQLQGLPDGWTTLPADVRDRLHESTRGKGGKG